MKPSPLISIKDINYRYNETLVLEDINLDIQAGDFLGLIGPNGSGKSTLLRLILGILPLQSGQIHLCGTPITEFKNWPRIGYVPQKASQQNQFPISVAEVVRLGTIATKNISDPAQSVRAALQQVHMESFQHRLLHKLSGGQQQRVFIAKALVSNPDLLILDEPTVGIDTQSQEEFYTLLTKLNKQGKTIIIVSHDISVISQEASSLACLNKTLVYHGNPQNFMHSEPLTNLSGKNQTFISHHH